MTLAFLQVRAHNANVNEHLQPLRRSMAWKGSGVQFPSAPRNPYDIRVSKLQHIVKIALWMGQSASIEECCMRMFEADLEAFATDWRLAGQAEGTLRSISALSVARTLTTPSAAPRRRALGIQRSGRIRFRPDASAVAGSR